MFRSSGLPSCVYVYSMCKPSVLGGHKKAQNFLGLELWMVLSHHVRTESRSSARPTSAFHH